jgi:hypothetical protein
MRHALRHRAVRGALAPKRCQVATKVSKTSTSRFLDETHRTAPYLVDCRPMKLLIVAGPYEADRIRRAAVSAGIEAIAVEPGESLSGWITATRPEVIVLAPQVISAEPAAALAKVRAVPRGRVPILLVGDADEEAVLRPLADGFFVRPIAADDLIEQARVAMADAAARPHDESGSGPHGGDSGRVVEPADGAASGPGRSGKSPALKPLVATQEAGPGDSLTREVPRAALEEAIAAGDEPPTRASLTPRGQRMASTFDRLTETIDADIDADLEAELREVVRVVGGLRKASKAGASGKAGGATADAGDGGAVARADAVAAAEALSELTDEGSQKTREVLQVGPDLDVSVAPAASRAPLSTTNTPLPRATPERDEAADRVVVQARFALCQDGDYFQILGLERDTEADEIRQAGDAWLARLAPTSLHPFVAAEFAEQLKEVRVVVAEAVRLLGDDRLRGQYRAHLPAAVAPVPVPPSSVNGDAAGAS